MDSPLGILQKYFKFDAFKKSQKEIIDLVLEGRDCLAVLPTGGGKSVCYQIPGLYQKGICLVISPLLSLMHDQVSNLQKKGIKALMISSSLNQEEIITAFDNLRYGDFKFLYLSPEKLQSEFIQGKIRQLEINLIAVDEAHCISEWGHDFRPAYLKIPVIREIHPNVPVLALTATATTLVKKDIVKHLKMQKAMEVYESLKRENLALKVVYKETIYQTLQHLLAKSDKPAIIYSNSRKKVKDTCDFLNRNNLSASYYHGGLSNDEKKRSFQNWTSEKTRIMVATNAFGMGIDKQNVQTIIHIDLPASLENYMQEAGRAGRNKEAAFAYVISNENSIHRLQNQTSKGVISLKELKSVYKNLNHYFDIAYGNLPEESFDFNLVDFCSHYQLELLATYNAIKLLEREQVLLLGPGFSKRSSIKFKTSPGQIFKIAEKGKSDLVKVLLRSHGGILEHSTTINETVLSKKLNCSLSNIKKHLRQLEKDGIIDYRQHENMSSLKFLLPREDQFTINKLAKDIEGLNKVKIEKMKAVINYVNNKELCRSKALLSYFEEDLENNCGQCDVCLVKNKIVGPIDYEQVSLEIMNLFSSNEPLSIQHISKELNYDPNTIIDTLHLLLENDKLSITSQNKLEKISNE